MVPGDYYVVRVRPTSWLLRSRVLSPVPSTSCHRSSFHGAPPSAFDLSYGPIGADVRIYGVCIQHTFTCTHAHAYTCRTWTARTFAPIYPRPSVARGDVSGLLFEQKAPKQNAIMISPKDGWSKLPQIRVPAPRMAMQRALLQKCLLAPLDTP